METRKVSVQLLEKILNYLATKPYLEVAGLIQEISSLPREETVPSKV